MNKISIRKDIEPMIKLITSSKLEKLKLILKWNYG